MTCIQCHLSPDALIAAHGSAILLTRKRPLGPGEYQICLACARIVRQEQESRAAA